MTLAWEGPAHNVVAVDEAGYKSCAVAEDEGETEGWEGPWVFRTSREGTYHFICGVGGTVTSLFSLTSSPIGWRSL